MAWKSWKDCVILAVLPKFNHCPSETGSCVGVSDATSKSSAFKFVHIKSTKKMLRNCVPLMAMCLFRCLFIPNLKYGADFGVPASRRWCPHLNHTHFMSTSVNLNMSTLVFPLGCTESSTKWDMFRFCQKTVVLKKLRIYGRYSRGRVISRKKICLSHPKKTQKRFLSAGMGDPGIRPVTSYICGNYERNCRKNREHQSQEPTNA